MRGISGGGVIRVRRRIGRGACSSRLGEGVALGLVGDGAFSNSAGPADAGDAVVVGGAV